MLSLFTIAFLGAFFNRLRGGGLHDWVVARPKMIALCSKLGLWKNDSLLYVKDLNAIAFAITFGLCTKIYLIPVLYAAMRLSFAPGWGGYIGAMVDRKTYHDRRDVLLLDKWFRSNTYPVLSGWAALTLRGFMSTVVLTLPFIFFSPNWPYMTLIGLLMGSTYLLCITVCGRITNRMNGWQWGEYVFGAILWSLYFTLLRGF